MKRADAARGRILAMTVAVVIFGGTAAVPAQAAEPTPGALAEVGEAGAQVVSSPDGDLRVAVTTVDGRLTYSVNSHRKALVGASGLGLDLAGRPSLTQGMSIASVERRTINETRKPL